MIAGLIFAMLLAVEVFGKMGGVLLFLAIAFMPKSWIKGIKEDDKKHLTIAIKNAPVGRSTRNKLLAFVTGVL